MNLQTLCSLTCIDESDILNVYLTGSRVFGTHNPDSDYDLKIVVKNTYSGMSSLRICGLILGPLKFTEINSLVDLKIYKEFEFVKAISDHDMQVLFCLFLPAEVDTVIILLVTTVSSFGRDCFRWNFIAH